MTAIDQKNQPAFFVSVQNQRSLKNTILKSKQH